MQPSNAAQSAGITKPVAEFALAKLAKLRQPVTVPELAAMCGYAARGGMHSALPELERLGYAQKAGRRDRAVTWEATQAGRDAQVLIDAERAPKAPSTAVAAVERLEAADPSDLRTALEAEAWEWANTVDRRTLEAMSRRQLQALLAAMRGEL